MQEVELGRARADRLHDRDPVLAGEEDAALADRLLDALEVVVLVRVAPRRVADFRGELVPEGAHELQVVCGGDANHGMRCESKRYCADKFSNG